MIAADDNAQSMFVVPYLKDKVRTPVMFCAVNAAPEKYGYPASHISGILERPHWAESLGLLRQLVPSVRTFGYIVRNNNTGKAYAELISNAQRSYPAKLSGFRLVNTVDEATDAARELSSSCDTLYIAALRGLPDEKGNVPEEKGLIQMLAKTYGKPTFGDSPLYVRYGLLCAVGTTGQEQGEVSAKMLLKAMKGTSVSEIPVTRNQNGSPILNVAVIKKLGIRLPSTFLQQMELVRTEK